MTYVLTEGERRFIMEVLQECSEHSDDLEQTCEEAVNILTSLKQATIED